MLIVYKNKEIMWLFNKKKKETRVEFLCNGKSAIVGLSKCETRRLLENSIWLNPSKTYGTIPYGLITTVFEGIFNFDADKYAEIKGTLSASIYEKVCWEILE
jgi:hypothetical protein